MVAGRGHILWRHAVKAACLALTVLGCAAANVAQASDNKPINLSSPAWVPNEDDSWLFDLRSGQYRLGDGVRGYQTPQGICVDLADMVLALDLAVRVDR